MSCPPRRWRRGARVPDAPLGPKPPRSPGLTPAEAVLLVAVRPHTRLPLDDGLEARQATGPRRTRASLPRGRKRHHLSRRPDSAGARPANKPFTPSPVGYFHLDRAELRPAEGTCDLVVAIDRTCKVASAALSPQAIKTVAAPCRGTLLAAIPEKIPLIRTDPGMQFPNRPREPSACQPIGARVCQAHGIEHRRPHTH
jgi:hypothetical protein